MINPELLSKLNFWISERESIREQKERGDPKPWTSDPVLQQFKFCNVRREDDRVTKWFAANWRNKSHWDNRNFVAAIILGRVINWPETLAEFGYPYEWNPVELHHVLVGRAARGLKVFTGAYMVSQYGSKKPKAQLVTENADRYFKQLPVVGKTLQSTWENLQMYEGVGSFMAGQVVADLKHTKYLVHAPDWHNWAALGPGSSRGINRLYDRPINFNLSQDQALDELREIRDKIEVTICLQNVQNCMCEFDKYMRVLTGQGVPRARYDGYGP